MVIAYCEKRWRVILKNVCMMLHVAFPVILSLSPAFRKFESIASFTNVFVVVLLMEFSINVSMCFSIKCEIYLAQKIFNGHMRNFMLHDDGGYCCYHFQVTTLYLCIAHYQ
jgi:hypothetical protein